MGFKLWILCHQILQPPSLLCCPLYFIYWRALSLADCVLPTWPPWHLQHVDDLTNTLAFQFFDLFTFSATHSYGHYLDLVFTYTYITPKISLSSILLLGHHLLSFHFIYSIYYLYSINCLILLSKHFSNTQLIPWFNNLNTPLWILINSLSLSPYITLPSKFQFLTGHSLNLWTKISRRNAELLFFRIFLPHSSE